MQIARDEVSREFQQLRQSFTITSWPNGKYNCIAWAAEDFTQWWWPDGINYWPLANYNDSIQNFIEAFRVLGYEPCENGEPEDGVEKAVIYASAGRVKHMARQMENGTWTSKLGGWYDIGHEGVEEVHCAIYGLRAQYLKRKRDVPHIPSPT